MQPGPVALVGQSGGVLLYANHILADRGIAIGHLVSTGNEADLGCADFIAFFAQEPSTKVIFCYLEAIKDVSRFKAACAMAQRAGKPVIVFKLGSSEAGRQAAMTHTGALSGSSQAFDAVLGGHGAIRVETLDEAIEAIEFAVHLTLPVGPDIGALSLSGAYRGILLDGAAGTALRFPELAPDVEARLSALLSVGSSAGNPADGGFTVLTSVDKYVECVDILCDDPGLDLLILQAELPREEGMAASWEERFQRIHDLVAARGKKLAFISMFSRMFTDYSRVVRAKTAQGGVRAGDDEVVAGARSSRHMVAKLSRGGSGGIGEGGNGPLLRSFRSCAIGPMATTTTIALDEAESKALLAAYGIAVPKEIIATSVEDAVGRWEATGYPVVIKALSQKLLHKSDVGGVILDIANADAVRNACRQIAADGREAGPGSGSRPFSSASRSRAASSWRWAFTATLKWASLLMVGSGGLLLEMIELMSPSRRRR